MSAFRSLVRKETRHILRDRQTLVVLLLLPLVMVLLFGFAIRTDVRHIRLAVVDPAPDAATRALTAELMGTPAFGTVRGVPAVGALDGLFRRGEVDAALVFPAGFASDWARSGAQVQVVTDALNATYGQTVEAYVTSILRRWEREHGGGGRVVVLPAVQMRYNPTLASEHLFVPGLLAFVLNIVSSLMTAITLAREKETGTMEVLLVSPLRPVSIVIAKVTPYVALAFTNAVTTLVLARAVFGVPLRGSLVLLLFECLLYALVALGLGVLISSKAPDQRAATMAVLLGTMIPTMALSGFLFPISSLPAPLRVLTNVVPATWFITIARGIMLKGAGLALLWRETLILAGMAVLFLALSARNVKDRLE
ncbi:MAG TPA: ABC transporter permease [Rhodothermales bacterium]|nr:ABC transporter permease [Rhodothermales bacterium]